MITIPKKIARHTVDVKEESGTCHLFFTSVFQLEFVRSHYNKELETLTNGKGIIYTLQQGNENHEANKETKKLLGMLEDKESFYCREIIETLIYLVNNKKFQKYIIGFRVSALNASGTKELADALLYLRKKAIDNDFFTNQKIKLYSELGKTTPETRNDKWREVDFFQWLEILIFICQQFGLREDIYGDILVSYTFYDFLRVPAFHEFWRDAIPPARIVSYGNEFGETEEGMTELKIVLYHDSKLPEVISFIKDKWDVIECIQRHMIPKEKWQGKSSENLKRDVLAFSVYSKLKSTSKTREVLKSQYGVTISEGNLRTVISRLKKEQNRLSKSTLEIVVEQVRTELSEIDKLINLDDDTPSIKL